MLLGLAKKHDDCVTCPELRWSDGRDGNDAEGFWADNQPEGTEYCVYGMKNMVDYVYDRPYVWSYGNCYIIRSFVCERMAAPVGMYSFLNKYFEE